MFRRFLRDPLFAFVVIGAAVFLADVLWQEGASDAVVVTQGDVDLLAELWNSRMGRPPNPVELQDLVHTHVTEEVMVREARRLGLDRSDPIIRRRLAQKLTFLVEDLAALEPPGEQELRSWFEARRDEYESRATVTFDHIYFRGDGGHEAALAARGTLEDAQRGNWRELGDPSLLARTYRAASREAVCGDFGPEFCGALDELIVAPAWQGPVKSTYGSHLVRVLRKAPAGLPEYEAVRERVLADYQQELRNQAGAELLDELHERYQVQLP